MTTEPKPAQHPAGAMTMDDLIENNPSQACIDVINTYMNGRKPVGNKNMTAEDVADQIRQLNHGSGEAFELDFQHAAQLIRDYAVQETERLRAGVCYAIETLETQLAETQQQLAAVRAALKGLSDMYSHAWDSVDGNLLMIGDSIPRFEAAHEAAMQALTPRDASAETKDGGIMSDNPGFYNADSLLAKIEQMTERLTQKGLAQHLGISTSYLNDVLKRRRTISAELAEKLGYQKLEIFMRKP